jgi:hypothetical protein
VDSPSLADADARIKMSIHSFLVETPSRRIIVDTGIGTISRTGGFQRGTAATVHGARRESS